MKSEKLKSGSGRSPRSGNQRSVREEKGSTIISSTSANQPRADIKPPHRSHNRPSHINGFPNADTSKANKECASSSTSKCVAKPRHRLKPLGFYGRGRSKSTRRRDSDESDSSSSEDFKADMVESDNSHKTSSSISPKAVPQSIDDMVLNAIENIQKSVKVSSEQASPNPSRLADLGGAPIRSVSPTDKNKGENPSPVGSPPTVRAQHRRQALKDSNQQQLNTLQHHRENCDGGDSPVCDRSNSRASNEDGLAGAFQFGLSVDISILFAESV